MSEPSYRGGDRLAEILWKMATVTAREQYEARVSALEEDVAAIREHLVVRTDPDTHSVRVPEHESPLRRAARLGMSAEELLNEIHGGTEGAAA